MADSETAQLHEDLCAALEVIRSLDERVAELDGARREPVAIIGMACRLPSGVETLDRYWELLERGEHVLGPFPDRWQLLHLSDPDPDSSGKSYATEGGFIRDLEGFDARFFGISEREALAMEPQQRLVLEVAWEALEHACIVPASLNETRAGVFVGAGGTDYGGNFDLDECDGHVATGNSSSVISGRLAYTLGLQGPAMTVDTACSASLVAIHLACASLRAGDSTLALAGGVTAMTSPTAFVEFSRLGGLSRSGRCKAFSADSDGAIWSEGCGMVVLKCLKDAQRDGDHVLALIRGSAVNQDGRSQGLTAPNGPSQVRVIQQALAASDLRPEDVDVVEAHGTGTPLGDPIEAGALSEVYGVGRDPGSPLYLGSCKSNLGHTQAAAGVAGLIKMVLALRHESLPKTLFADHPSTEIPWEGSGLSLLQQARPWRAEERVRRAGVSAFAFMGTNAHVILEEPPAPALVETPSQSPAEVPTTGFPPLLLSSASAQGCAAQARRWAEWWADHPETPLEDVARTAAEDRTHFEHRCALAVADAEEARRALEAIRDGERPAWSFWGRSDMAGKVAVLFSGQGSQRLGMGRDLYESSRVYRASFDEVAAALDAHLPKRLAEVIFADDEGSATALQQTEFTQPALFALEVSLFRVWESLGLRPAFVAGHSIGELSAAHVAGMLGLTDAAKLVCARGRLMQACRADGAMASIEATEAEVRAALANTSGLDIAGVNGPRQVVVSGNEGDVVALCARFEALGRRVRHLAVSHAFHSHHMDSMLEQFRAVAESCSFQAPRIPLVSMLGDAGAPEMLQSAHHWTRQVRETVRFDSAVETLRANGVRTFVECGPHGVLSGMGAACAPDDVEVAWVPTLRRTEQEARSLTGAVCALHVRGVDLDFSPILGTGLHASLPTYAFEHKHFWKTSRGRHRDVKLLGLEEPDHALLGACVSAAEGDAHFFCGFLSTRRDPWLADHRVYEQVVFPGTGLLDLALAGARSVGSTGVSELVLSHPLVIPPEGVSVQVQVSGTDTDGAWRVGVYSRHGHESGPWVEHAVGGTGDVPGDSRDAGAFQELRSWDTSRWCPVELDGLYSRLDAAGLGYGPTFRGLVEQWQDEENGVHFGRVILPGNAGEATDSHGVHPALLDAALHMLPSAFQGHDGSAGVLLPYAWSDVEIHATGAREARVRIEISPAGADSEQRSATLWVSDGSGEPVLRAGLQMRPSRAASAFSAGVDTRDLYRPTYVPLSAEETVWDATQWVSVGGRGELALQLGLRWYEDFASLCSQMRGGHSLPRAVLLEGCGNTSLLTPPDPMETEVGEPTAEVVRGSTEELLLWLQQWLASPELAESALVVATRGGVSAGIVNETLDLTQAPWWGLVRALRSEQPERGVRLLDLEASPDPGILRDALARWDEPELVLRGGRLLAPRLERAASGGDLPELPEATDWRLELEETGRLDGFCFAALEEASEPLLAHEVEVAVRAAGINFRDVLHALGMVQSKALGLECAGVVRRVGADVSHLAVGDRVMGLAHGSFGTLVRTDGRTLVKIPSHLGHAEAATLPLTYLTAVYALEELGKVQAGDKVLIHAAAGGVGMAASALARARGAEVYGTASPGKWDALRGQGFDETHLANSRDLSFEAKFRAEVPEGFDVVLNSLAHEFVDASLRLLRPGGCFLEMGKTDVRDADEVARAHGDVRYRAFETTENGPEHTGRLLARLVQLLDTHAVQPLPFTSHDLRQAPAVLRFMAKGEHVGKLVLTVPAQVEAHGTALVTGGTGALGAALATHLVEARGLRHLVLTSRRGPGSPGAQELVEHLRARGAEHVDIVACDAADRQQLAAVIEGIAPDRPLTAVYHLAGVLDDGMLASQTPDRLQHVMVPKVDGALHLHELTRDRDVAEFVMFSSVAAVFGGAGQSNYAAANALLDQLAVQRRRRGLSGQSLAWGLWGASGGGMGAALSEADRQRIRRQGFGELSLQAGLDLLETAQSRPEAQLVPVRLNLSGIQASGAVPPLLRGLLRPGLRRASGAPSAQQAAALRDRLTSMGASERKMHLVRLVQQEAAAVLGLPDPEDVETTRELKKLGLDSLTSVDLRNRLSLMAGAALPSTLAFDYPTVESIAMLLVGVLQLEATTPEVEEGPPSEPEQALKWALKRVSAKELHHAGLLAHLLEMAGANPIQLEAGDARETRHEPVVMSLQEISSELDDILGAE